MKILADASLPGLTKAFPKPFELTTYHQAAELKSLLPGQDILLCRANLQINADLLAAQSLRFIATASSGTDHIDKNILTQKNIQLIDAKGANASAVADYVCACLAYLLTTNKLAGRKAGIIGLGKVGEKVRDRLSALDFSLALYDPPKALVDEQFRSCNLEDLRTCDLICIHAELQDSLPYPSRNLLDHAFLYALKDHCVIINAARGDIVNEEALLSISKPLLYCTDVYSKEPAINPAIVERAYLCTPHIAGHSLEAKFLAVAQVSKALHEAFGLTPPASEVPKLNLRPIPRNETWAQQILSIYNPAEESRLLKEAMHKQEAFLSLRKAHNTRHDFAAYQVRTTS